MRRKIVRLDLFRGFGVCRIVEENCAQNGLLRVDVGGQTGVETPQIRNGGHLRSLGGKEPSEKDGKPARKWKKLHPGSQLFNRQFDNGEVQG
jgi:hypothetical protein